MDVIVLDFHNRGQAMASSKQKRDFRAAAPRHFDLALAATLDFIVMIRLPGKRVREASPH
jgi:hypothetical protein